MGVNSGKLIGKLRTTISLDRIRDVVVDDPGAVECINSEADYHRLLIPEVLLDALCW